MATPSVAIFNHGAVDLEIPPESQALDGLVLAHPEKIAPKKLRKKLGRRPERPQDAGNRCHRRGRAGDRPNENGRGRNALPFCVVRARDQFAGAIIFVSTGMSLAVRPRSTVRSLHVALTLSTAAWVMVVP